MCLMVHCPVIYVLSQEMWSETGLGTDGREDVETSGGGMAEGSGECDDEDGCQGSGRGDKTGEFARPLHLRLKANCLSAFT